MVQSTPLFPLLRLALDPSAEAPDLSALTGADWEALVNLSFEQGVAAVAVDGLQSLYDRQPEMELALDSPELEGLKYEWFGSTFQAEEDYRRHVEAISALAKVYGQEQMNMMLLKGYGLGLNYPVPSHRPTGDIDIYLPDWKKGDGIIRRMGIRVDAGHEHHTTFTFSGVMVENHYDFINTRAHRDARRIEAKLKELSHRGCSLHRLPDGTGILLPSADFNALFLIRHLGQHFAGERVTLRQVLDWGLFLKAEGAKVHWDEVSPFLRQMGIWTFFNQINAICADFLGLELKDVPAIERNAELEMRILEDILHPEFAEEKPKAILPVLAFKARRWWHNRWKHPLVYNEWWLPMLLTLVWSHLRRIKTIKD